MRRTDEHVYDELLVLRCQEGDVEAFRELVGRWQPRLRRHAQRLTGDHDGASDVLQDAWLAVTRGIRRLDDPARFAAWAYRIVTFKAADWTRQRVRSRSAAGQVASDAEQPSTATDDGGDVARLRTAVRDLPNELRLVIHMHYGEELGIRTIAEILDIAPGTVKSRLHRARHELRSIIERAPT